MSLRERLLDATIYHEHKPMRRGRDVGRCRLCFRRIYANREWYLWERQRPR